ncbi:MAG: cell envelope integrity protein CreD [Deltaproteobacteria bacterium]|jgi:inner membrane protein|nr:cell envelope integrity protein CreD [Deltaproteobacteria bacterium]
MDNLLVILLILLLVGLIVGVAAGSVLLWKKARGHFDPKTTSLPKAHSPTQRMSFGSRILIKLGLVAILSLVLLFPLNLVGQLTQDREKLSDSVVANISDEWGLPQVVTGPFLAVPITFSYQVTQRVPMETGSPTKVFPNPGPNIDFGPYPDQNRAPFEDPANQSPGAMGQAQESLDDNGESLPMANAPGRAPWANGEIVHEIVYLEKTVTRLALIAPRNLRVTGDFANGERKRGIYKAQVYSAKLRLAGDFSYPSKEELAKLDFDKKIKSIDWSQAKFLVGLSDVAAIQRAGQLTFDQKSHDFRPESGAAQGLPTGFFAPLNLQNREDSAAFDLELDFAGSGSFHLNAVSRSTLMSLTSNWPHPSFSGSGLPLERTIGQNGFEANWTVPDLVHAHPELFLLDPNNEPTDENDYLIGVSFIKPVDDYLVIERSLKFGAVFILLTFLTLVVSDLGPGKWAQKKGLELHPLQYAIVGLALVLFYLITLSLSEHLGFALAYLLASLTTIVLISGYAYLASGSRNLGLFALSLTALLYSVMYLILRQEDYALLSGTILLVAVLIALMILTSKVNRPEPLEDKPTGPIECQTPPPGLYGNGNGEPNQSDQIN